jgi:hypothetical protein
MTVPAVTRAQTQAPVQTQTPVPALPVQPDRGAERSSQRLMLEVDFLGGYDDNLVPTGQASSVDPLAVGAPGYLGFTTAALRYSAGRAGREFEAAGLGFANSYSTSRKPFVGGEGSARGNLTFGARNHLDLSQSLRTDPIQTFGMFGTLPASAGGEFSQGATVPNELVNNPTNGLVENRSTAMRTGVISSREWSRRDTTRVEYRFDRYQYEQSNELDTRMHVATVAYDRSFGRSLGLHLTYRYSDIASIDPRGLMEPLLDQTGEAGVSYVRSISRDRTLSLRGGGGGTSLESTDSVSGAPIVSRVVPTGYAGAIIGLTRSWQLSGDYRRSVSGLNGLLGDVFIADSGTVQLGGALPSGMQATISSAYSTGQSIQSEAQASRYDTIVTSAQLEFFTSRIMTANVIYTNVQYRIGADLLAEVETLLPGLTSSLNRHSLRLGVSLDLPIAGRRPRPSRRGN